jgi:RNase P protein component
MKDTKRAARRTARRNHMNRLVEHLFHINTGVETRQEMRALIIKRAHCETTGRRKTWLLTLPKKREQAAKW